jgi:hypothetical protein
VISKYLKVKAALTYAQRRIIMATTTRNNLLIGLLILGLLIGAAIGIGLAGNYLAPGQCQNTCEERADREHGFPTSTYGKILKNISRGHCNFACWLRS